MPRTVLLLDDDPQFRHLLRPALEIRGMRVLEAGRAADATEIIASEPVHMVVVDGLLPDANGIQWIAEQRAAGNQVPIAFVSAFWSDSASYRLLTQDLGAAFVARKPIMPDRIAARIERFLPGPEVPRTPPPPPPADEDAAPETPAEAAARKRMRDEYLRVLPETISSLAEAASRTLETLDPEAAHRARSLAADVRSSAGAFGLERIEKAARATERVLAGLSEDSFWRVADAMIRHDTGSPPPIAAEDEAADPYSLLAPRVLLVDDDPSFVEYMKDAGTHLLMDVRAAMDPDEALAAVSQVAPDVAFVAIPFGAPDRSYAVIERLHAGDSRGPIPVGAIALDDSTTARITAIQTGASLFLTHPVDADMLLLAAHQLSGSRSFDATRIAIVTSDQEVRDHVTELLCDAGMVCTPLADTAEMVPALEIHQPDAIILDSTIGTTSGLHLCGMLRASPRWHDTVIFLLSATTGEGTRMAALTAGADDCLPRFAPADTWLPTIQGRLRRVGRLRRLSDRDPLTHMPLRSGVVPALTARLSGAQRHRGLFSIALVDVDGLERINEVRGRAGGDRVLTNLAALLRSRFRLEDVRGRIGGDEFVVGFSGVGARSIGPVIEKAQRDFASLALRGLGGEHFRATFSAGISTYPHHGRSIPALIASAVRRLHVAKLRIDDRAVVW